MIGFDKNLLHWRPQLGERGEDEDRARIKEHRRPPEQTLFFHFCISAQKLPSSSRSSSLRSRQRNDDHSWTTTCSSPPAARSSPPSSPPSRVEVKEQPVEVADRDDLLQGDDDGVVQLLHDGRLPLQVLGDVDVGVFDLVNQWSSPENFPVQQKTKWKTSNQLGRKTCAKISLSLNWICQQQSTVFVCEYQQYFFVKECTLHSHLRREKRWWKWEGWWGKRWGEEVWIIILITTWWWPPLSHHCINALSPVAWNSKSIKFAWICPSLEKISCLPKNDLFNWILVFVSFTLWYLLHAALK